MTHNLHGQIASLKAVLAVVLLAAAGVCAPARAADPPATTPSAGEPWQFQATLYGWGTALDGNVGVRRLPTLPVNASFGELVSNLQGALPVSFLAKKDGWTLLFDFYWTHLATDSTTGAPAFAQTSVGLKQTIASAVAGYRLPVGGADFDLSATAGFRYQRISVDAALTSFAVPFALSQSGRQEWLDPVFGLTLQYRINDKWFFNALGDIGGFGLGSKLTWQAFAAVGYNWTSSWSTALGYRALYTDYEATTGFLSSFRYETTIHGPFMSVAYHF